MADLADASIDTPARTRSLTGDLAVAAAATAAALVTWLLWTQAGGVELAAQSGGGNQTIGAAAVVVSAAFISLLGLGLLRLLETRSRNGLRIWTWVAAGVLLFSLAGPLGATTTSAGIGLVSLHVVVGVALTLGARVRR
ncbi:MAG: DUF6069 family protein [Nocardioides sp.]|nr:DUF6069 family protein [Nocardioides sp.]